MEIKGSNDYGTFSLASDLREVKGIKVEKMVDVIESGRKIHYVFAEIMAYFLWPIICGLFLGIITGNLLLGIVISFLVFAWPFLKGYYGKLRADDPRQGIKSSSFWYDGFLFLGSEPLRTIRKYSAASRALDVIYNWPCHSSDCGRFFIKSSDFPDDNWLPQYIKKPIKAWTNFWIGMPIAQDVRSRLQCIAEEYRNTIISLAEKEPGRTINILEIAGGSLQAVIMGISWAKNSGAIFDYRVVSIEPDNNFARKRAEELIMLFQLEKNHFSFIDSKISTSEVRKDKMILNLLSSNGLKDITWDFVVCIGLGDYYYTYERISSLLSHLKQLNPSEKIIIANISDNFVERFFLHSFIQWPKMKYRSLDEWVGIITSIFPSSEKRVIQTPQEIFNIAVIQPK